MVASVFTTLFAVASALACTVSAAPARLQGRDYSMAKRDNSTTPFEFYTITTASNDFVTDITMGIDYQATSTLTNMGDEASIPITGNMNVNGTVYTLSALGLTTPALFTLDGEFYPAAVRVETSEGLTLSMLCLLIPDTPDHPVINTMLASIGLVPESGDSTTISSLDFTYFISEFITSDVFYTVSANGADYLVRQLPIELGLDNWRALKKVLTVAGNAA